MELGNLVFGNSRGEVEVPRLAGFEQELFRLFDAYVSERDNSWREYGVEFENDVFSVTPYWWGECTCGWEDVDDGHERAYALEHRPECYQTEYMALPCRLGEEERWAIRALYEKRGWDTTAKNWWYGCGGRCDCDYDERYASILAEYAVQFGYEGHRPDCKLVTPNFLHKPSGYALSWYKYPLRDSYANRVVSLAEFRRMIDECVASIGTQDVSSEGAGGGAG